jgi:hypothetical protein
MSQVTTARTRWFTTETTEPGQPGVFEVDPVRLTDDPTEDPVARFSFFNGRDFGPIAHSPAAAYALRFHSFGLTPRAFRGLPTEA